MLGSVPSTAIRVNEEPVATQHWERWTEEAKQGGFGPWKEECAPLGKLRLEKGIARFPTVIYLQILNLPIFFFLIFENFNPDNPLKIKFGIVCKYVLCVCMQGWARKTVSKASTPHPGTGVTDGFESPDVQMLGTELGFSRTVLTAQPFLHPLIWWLCHKHRQQWW